MSVLKAIPSPLTGHQQSTVGSAVSDGGVCHVLSARDVLPFPLELPEAIAKANSHKQLESISHMGIGRFIPNLMYRLSLSMYA